MFLRIRLPILAISVSRATFLAAHKSIEGCMSFWKPATRHKYDQGGVPTRTGSWGRLLRAFPTSNSGMHVRPGHAP